MSTCFQISSLSGCEDIILEELAPSTLLPTLEWSSLPHGSDWVYRQAMQFLQDEFVNIAQSEAFSFIPKKYLAEALKSDFLQVFDIPSITHDEVKIISVITAVSLLSTLPGNLKVEVYERIGKSKSNVNISSGSCMIFFKRLYDF